MEITFWLAMPLCGCHMQNFSYRSQLPQHYAQLLLHQWFLLRGKLCLGWLQCHMFELQLPLDCWHHLMRYLHVQVVFLPPKGSILVCKYDGHEQHSLGSTYRAQWVDFPSSLALCAVACRVLNHSINSPPQLPPNPITKYAIGLKSAERKTPKLKPVLRYVHGIRIHVHTRMLHCVWHNQLA